MVAATFPSVSTLRFAVLGELAMGGMGRLDLARLVEDAPGHAAGQLVAVKRLHPHLARDREFVQMFVDEVWFTGAIAHPHVVRLVGWGSDDHGIFLATEFIRGASLAILGGEGPPRVPDAFIASIGSRVAQGLAAAHAFRGADGHAIGIVHRDVTPGNILLGVDGALKIADFGIAKVRSLSKKRTATGVLKGKIPYMAPEYVANAPIDGRSDLYSLGVVLYELACGATPFEAERDAVLLRQVLEEPAPPLRSRAPWVDDELAEIIDRLLAKSPAARVADGAELARALDGWLDRRRVDAHATRAAIADVVRRRGAAHDARVEAFCTARTRRDRSDVDDAPTLLRVYPDRDAFAAALTETRARPHTRVVANRRGDSPRRATRRVDATLDDEASLADTMSDARPPLSGEAVALEIRERARPPGRAARAATFAAVLVAAVAVVALETRTAPVDPAATRASSASAEPRDDTAASGAPVTDVDPASPRGSEPSSPSATGESATATAKSHAPRATPAPRDHARSAPRGAPRTVAAPACTPHDFDYPRCLKGS